MCFNVQNTNGLRKKVLFTCLHVSLRSVGHRWELPGEIMVVALVEAVSGMCK